MVIQVLVALGTLLLASATFLLAWNSVKERKGNEARELAVGAYNPLRLQVLSWMNLEDAYGSTPIDVWTSLKQTQLNLAGRVPKPVTTQLDNTEILLDKILFLRETVKKKIRVKTEETATALLPSRNAGSEMIIRFYVGERAQYVRWFDPTWAWLARKNFSDYVDQYAKQQFSDETWSLDVVVGNTIVGAKKEADEVAKKLFEYLDKQSEATEFRDLLEKLSKVAKSINEAIEKELKKH